MTLRNLHSVVAVAAFTGTVLGGTALPAHAGSIFHGEIQLTLTKEGPIWGDNNNLIYNVHVNNAGPQAATGVVVRVSGWFCEGSAWSASACTPLQDRDHPGQPMSYDIPLDTIEAGGKDSFPVETFLPNEDSGTVRTTVEVVRSDQFDTESIPNTCAQGWNPQPDCMSDVQSES